MSEQKQAGQKVLNQHTETTIDKASLNRREFLAWTLAGATAVFGVAGGITMVMPDPKTDPLMQSLIPSREVNGQPVYPIIGGFTYPRIKEGTFGGKFIAERKAGSFTADERPELNASGKFYIVKVGALPPTEDGGVAGHEATGLVALYQVCTHLGCLVPFDSGQNRFICPCHGSTFERNGDYVLGPAPRSMDQFEVSVTEDGTVIVDTGKKRTGKFHA